MPRIPSYQRQNTITGQAPNAPANVAAFGQVGQAIAGAGSALAGVANDILERKQAQEKEDQYFAAQRIGKIATDYATDFEVEFKQKLELDAYNSGKAVDDWMVKTTDKLLDIPDEKVRFQVNDHIQSLGVKLKDQLAAHEAGQRKVVAFNTRKGTLESASKAAYQGIGTFDDNLGIITGAIVNDPTMGAAERENALIAGQSAIAEARLDGMISRNPAAAAEFLKSGMFNKFLTADKMEQADKKIKQLMVDANTMKGVNLATDIFTANKDKPLSEVRELVKKAAGGENDIYTAAIAEINAMDVNRDEERKERAKVATDAVELSITTAREKKTVISLKDIPVAQWKALKEADPAKAESIIRMLNNEGEEYREKQRRIARETKEDRERRTLETFVSLSMNPDILAQTDITKAWKMGDISDSQYKDLANKKREILSNPDKKDQLITEAELVKSIGKKAGLKDGSEDYTLYLNRVQESRKAYRASRGEDMPNVELEKEARRQLYKVEVKDKWRDQPTYKITFEDIPDKYRNAIEKRFKDAGRPYTSQQVVDMYVRTKQLEEK